MKENDELNLTHALRYTEDREWLCLDEPARRASALVTMRRINVAELQPNSLTMGQKKAVKL